MDGIEAARENQTAKIGMWLFILTELFLFVVLFIVFLSYRSLYGEEFHQASMGLNGALATANTLILLTSSFSVAVSVAAVKRDNRGLAVAAVGATIALALLFLVNKYMEWSEKIAHGIYPGSDGMAGLGDGTRIFYNLYYVMTGLHAVHVVAGIVLFAVMAMLILKGRVCGARHAAHENTGLYWHMVDIIWIYLFSFFYLVS